MRQIDLDWADATKTAVTATRATIDGLKVKTFATRGEAEAFANKVRGLTGCVLSSLDMTDEQLAAKAAREARIRALLA